MTLRLGGLPGKHLTFQGPRLTRYGANILQNQNAMKRSTLTAVLSNRITEMASCTDQASDSLSDTLSTSRRTFALADCDVCLVLRICPLQRGEPRAVIPARQRSGGPEVSESHEQRRCSTLPAGSSPLKFVLGDSATLGPALHCSMLKHCASAGRHWPMATRRLQA